MPLLISADVKCPWPALLRQYPQHAQHEGTPSSTEPTGELNPCLGGGTPLAAPLLQISRPAHLCRWSRTLGTSTGDARTAPLPLSAKLPLPPPRTLLPQLLSGPVQTSAHYGLITRGLQR